MPSLFRRTLKLSSSLALLLAASLFSQTAPPDPKAFYSDPVSDSASRRTAYIAWAARSGNHGLYVQAARLAAGLPVEEAPIREALRFVNERSDTADFRVIALARLYRENKAGLIAAPLLAEIRQTLLDFKYWCDEPGPDNLMGEWSENHQILFHSGEYLAGQLFPDEVFTNNRQTGRAHMKHARGMILSWILAKAKAGFSEWDSNAYFPESIAALLNLADYAEDPEVVAQAAKLLDVIFFDMAVDSWRGIFGTSHGRTYEGTVLAARGEGTSPEEWIAWGMGSAGSPDNVTAVFLASAPRYRVPSLIEKIAQDRPEALVNNERQGLTIEAGKQIGLKFDDPNDVFLLWDSGRLSRLADAEQSLRTLKQFNFHRYEVVIKPYVEAVIGTYKALREMGVEAEGLDRTTLEQVNKTMYKTPDYQLSSAQDYRKGKAGYQQHIWQATLGPEQIVFTLNPSVSTKYWVGRFPRAIQYRNLLIALYDIPSRTPPGPRTIVPPDAGGNAMPSPGPAEELPAGYTEAIFHRGSYDEVVEKNGWIFGRKGQGYIALRSQLPAQWSANCVLKGEGLIAEGRKNIWICQLGRTRVDGAFPEWTEKIAAAPLRFEGLSVSYRAPGIGEAHMNWDDPLTIDGKPVITSGYARFDNPYCRSEWGSGRYEIHFGRESLVQDFSKPGR